tara:strand:+ start:594 stop:821 length:228 start_codon:yes stop_codon:yes gene_type:complete
MRRLILDVWRLSRFVAVTTSLFTLTLIGRPFATMKLSSSHFFFFALDSGFWLCGLRVLVCVLSEASEQRTWHDDS